MKGPLDTKNMGIGLILLNMFSNRKVVTLTFPSNTQ